MYYDKVLRQDSKQQSTKHLCTTYILVWGITKYNLFCVFVVFWWLWYESVPTRRWGHHVKCSGISLKGRVGPNWRCGPVLEPPGGPLALVVAPLSAFRFSRVPSVSPIPAVGAKQAQICLKGDGASRWRRERPKTAHRDPGVPQGRHKKAQGS